MRHFVDDKKAMLQHFNGIAGSYTDFRTLDEAPVRSIVEYASGVDQSICDLGCGTGRYLIALIKAFESKGTHVVKAYGVDISTAMLKKAAMESEGLHPDIKWLCKPVSSTGLLDNSISVVTSFNSIHHIPIKETLKEARRILPLGGIFAIYTRVLEQESEHIWGCLFPDYVSYSKVLTRQHISSFAKYDEHWRLIGAKDFIFKRKASLARICQQTRNKHYSTLARYTEDDFECAYELFVKNLEANYPNHDEIEYPSSYSLFIYQCS
jgi:ubiquinone/menaquinone biosynthesis C-methylase UbiE